VQFLDELFIAETRVLGLSVGEDFVILKILRIITSKKKPSQYTTTTDLRDELFLSRHSLVVANMTVPVFVCVSVCVIVHKRHQ